MYDCSSTLYNIDEIHSQFLETFPAMGIWCSDSENAVIHHNRSTIQRLNASQHLWPLHDCTGILVSSIVFAHLQFRFYDVWNVFHSWWHTLKKCRNYTPKCSFLLPSVPLTAKRQVFFSNSLRVKKVHTEVFENFILILGQKVFFNTGRRE